MAGLDSLAQAAGRCNREGLLTQGEVIVYNPECQAPAGLLRQGSQTSEELLGQGIVTDLLAPDSYKHYFDLLYSKGDLDEKGITNFKLDKELNFHFRKWADDFMLIDEDTEAIVVPFVPENAQESPVRVWLNMLANDPSQRWIYRKLQRFTVGVHKNKLSAFLADKRVEPVAGMLVALPSFYSPEIGLLTEDGHIAPNNFLV
jgi:CRISPR-associated endonuclease/helicase Cas3